VIGQLVGKPLKGELAVLHATQVGSISMLADELVDSRPTSWQKKTRLLVSFLRNFREISPIISALIRICRNESIVFHRESPGITTIRIDPGSMVQEFDEPPFAASFIGEIEKPALFATRRYLSRAFLPERKSFISYGNIEWNHPTRLADLLSMEFHPPILLSARYPRSERFREVHGIPQDGSRHFRLSFRIPLLLLPPPLSRSPCWSRLNYPSWSLRYKHAAHLPASSRINEERCFAITRCAGFRVAERVDFWSLPFSAY